VGITHLTGAARDGFATVLPGKLWRFDGSAAVTRCTAGWPGKPGTFTSSNLANVRGFLDGKEVPIAVQALRGTHPDGSYRSLGVQVVGVASVVKRAFRLEVWSTARSEGNTLTWIEPTYEVPGGEDATDWPAISHNAVVACTEPEYLCDSFITLMPLIPAADDPATVAAWNAKLLDQWTSNVANGIGNAGGAIYDHAHGCYAYYCRTGDLDWYEWGHKWAVQMDGAGGVGNSPLQAFSAVMSSNVNAVCTNNETFNPELIAGTYVLGNYDPANCVGVNEAWSMRNWSAVSGYWFSTWRAPMRYISFTANRATWPVTSEATAGTELISGGTRFNFGREINSILAGYLMECTTELSTSGGNPAGNLDNYGQMLEWVIDAIENRAWTAGDATTCPWLTGMLGIAPGSLNDDAVVGIENFQAAIPPEFLMMYYDLVKPDTRIPGMLLALGEIVEAQARATITGEPGFPTAWGTPYTDKDPVDIAAGTEGVNGASFPMHAPLFAWLWANTGQTKWRDLCDNSIVPANITTLPLGLKYWGEMWGGTRQQVGYYRNGGTIRGTTGVHPTTIVQPTTHATLG
jgi:hypothetical protein